MSQHTQHTAATKKKKGVTKGIVGAGEGAGEGTATAVGAATAAGRERKHSEKKPLDASMEQLKMHGSAKRPNASRRAAGSNWNSALGVLTTAASSEAQKSGTDGAAAAAAASGDEECANNTPGITENAAPAQSKAARLRQKRKAAQRNKYVAMDCEMVGVGLNGQDDMLARVSIVNKMGEVLLDKFVKPRQAVTDYRTSVSGIRPHDIENAEEFSGVQDEVVELLNGKILVGHGIRNDLAVLHIKHPYPNIRDTSRYKPLCRLVANGRTPSLKRVCQAILGIEIQTGEHNSVEDARAAMNIYNRLSSDWETYIQKHQHRHHHQHHGK